MGTLTDTDLSDAMGYAHKATEIHRYKLALKHRPDLFLGLTLRNKGKNGWKGAGIYVEDQQTIDDYMELELDVNSFDCTSFNCHPNDPTKNEEEHDKSCDFYNSVQSEVDSGGIQYQTCQSACFNITKTIDPQSGRPIPGGNYFLPGLDQDGNCRAINPQFLTWATIPVSRYSAAGKIEAFNSPDLPPFSVTDQTVSAMTPNYAYCQYFQKEYDPVGRDCYTTVGGYIARFFLGDVLTNFLYRENKNAIQNSLPRITRIGPSAREITLDDDQKVDLSEPSQYKRILRSLLLRANHHTEGYHSQLSKDGGLHKLIKRYFLLYGPKNYNVFKEDDVYGLINDLVVLFTKLSMNTNKDDIKKIFLDEIVNIQLLPKERAHFMEILNILLNYNAKIVSPLVHHNTSYNYYSVSQRKMKREAKLDNDLKPTPYRPNEQFWDAPITNLGIKIWEDLVHCGSLIGGSTKDFVFMDNIVANLGADLLVDKSLDIMAKGSKKVTSKLSSSLMGKLSARAGVKAASYFVVASVSRKVIGFAVKTIVKVAVQMLKMLAKLATLAFNVVAMVLTFVSILGLILDFAIDTSWMNQIKYKSDLEKYAHSLNESFRTNMNITDVNVKTAPFSPHDLLNFVVESNLTHIDHSFEASIDPETGESLSSYEQLMSQIYNDKPMFSEEENVMYLNKYYQYIGSRTINHYGQPIGGEKYIEQFDSQAKIDKIKNELSEILQQGSVYGRVIGYNTRRLVLATAIESEVQPKEYLTILLSILTTVLLGSLLRHRNMLLLFILFLYLHLLCVLNIKKKHLNFIYNSRIFNFDKTYDDTLNMGAIAYQQLMTAVAEYHRRYFDPFNKDIRLQYMVT